MPPRAAGSDPPGPAARDGGWSGSPTPRQRRRGRSPSLDSSRAGPCGRFPPALDSRRIEGFHSSRRWCVNSILPIVRTIASRQKNDSYGSNASASSACITCRRADCPTAARCCAMDISAGLLARSDRRRDERRHQEHCRARPRSRATRVPTTIHPSSRGRERHRDETAAKVVEQLPLRQHREWIRFAARRRPPPTRRRSHPTSCQSPRIQRRRRATSAL